jgi:hypothetical protein
MKEFGEVQAIVKQFPCAVLSEKEGLFGYKLGLAMHQLLGSGPKFGFWAMESPDQNVDRVVKKTLVSLTIVGDVSYFLTKTTMKSLDGNSPWKTHRGSRSVKVERRRRFLRHSSKI